MVSVEQPMPPTVTLNPDTPNTHNAFGDNIDLKSDEFISSMPVKGNINIIFNKECHSLLVDSSMFEGVIYRSPERPNKELLIKFKFSLKEQLIEEKIKELLFTKCEKKVELGTDFMGISFKYKDPVDGQITEIEYFFEKEFICKCNTNEKLSRIIEEQDAKIDKLVIALQVKDKEIDEYQKEILKLKQKLSTTINSIDSNTISINIRNYQDDDFVSEGTYCSIELDELSVLSGHGNGKIIVRDRNFTPIGEGNKVHKDIVTSLLLLNEETVLSSGKDGSLFAWKWDKKTSKKGKLIFLINIVISEEEATKVNFDLAKSGINKIIKIDEHKFATCHDNGSICLWEGFEKSNEYSLIYSTQIDKSNQIKNIIYFKNDTLSNEEEVYDKLICITDNSLKVVMIKYDEESKLFACGRKIFDKINTTCIFKYSNTCFCMGFSDGSAGLYALNSEIYNTSIFDKEALKEITMISNNVLMFCSDKDNIKFYKIYDENKLEEIPNKNTNSSTPGESENGMSISCLMKLDGKKILMGRSVSYSSIIEFK
jgi:hypothetical protein